MAKDNARIEAARKAYREALDAARASPTPEAWARLLAAGKELSATTESKPKSRRRRGANVVASEVIAAEAGAPVDREIEPEPEPEAEAEPEVEALE